MSIVCVFPYYSVAAKVPDRQLALGFCVYSSFLVINCSLFVRSLRAYVNFWNFLDILPFLATLFIWTKTACSYSISPKVVTQPASAPGGMTKDAYNSGFQELNQRPTSLNERLKCLCGLGDRRQ